MGASDDNDVVASFSNSASWMDFFAPGKSIRSARPGSSTTSLQGTSMSAPHVAGAITALRSLRPEATVGELVAALTINAVPIVDPGNGFSIPRIQVDAAAEGIVPGTELPEMVIVDDDANGVAVTTGSFESLAASTAYGGRTRRADGSGLDVFRFTPSLPRPGPYRLYAWWPVLTGAEAAIEFDVYSQDGQPTPLIVDQTIDGGRWVEMGEFNFGTDQANNYVEIRSPGTSPAVADALRFDYLAALPMDDIAPTLTGAQALAEDSVQLSFDEPLDAATAQTAANYAIDQGVSVTQAVLAGDAMSVTLTTSALTDGVATPSP